MTASSKPPIRSKTVWLGVMMTVASVLGLLAGEQWIQDYPQVVSGLGLTAGILTVVIRQYTTGPLDSRKE